jgi:hypothetical protein
VTSMHALGHLVSPEEVDAALRHAWTGVFGDR